MGDGDDCEVFELLVDKFLDFLFGHQVNVGGGFVHNDNLVLSEDSSDDADKLSFARGEVVATFFDFKVEWICFLGFFLVVTLGFETATFE